MIVCSGEGHIFLWGKSENKNGVVRGRWTLQEDCAVGTVPTLLTRGGGSLVTGYGEMLRSVGTVQPAFLFLEDCRDTPPPRPS